MMKRVLAALLCASFVVAACQKHSAEEAGEKVDQAVEKAKDAAEEAKDSIQGKEGPAEKSGEKLDNAVEDLKDNK
jgi:predicted small secreted protein